MQYIEHPFFENGAMLYTLSDGTHAFVYPNDDGSFSSWYTGCKIENVARFLNQCAEGQHDTLGSGWCDTWQNIHKQLADFN